MRGMRDHYRRMAAMEKKPMPRKYALDPETSWCEFCDRINLTGDPVCPLCGRDCKNYYLSVDGDIPAHIRRAVLNVPQNFNPCLTGRELSERGI